MAFVAAMNAPPETKVGVNGADVLTEAGVGDVRVSLFTMLNRGLGASYIASEVAAAPAAVLEDLLVMAMQTRDIRGGKGERELFYAMMGALYEKVPAAVEALIPLVPEYGCWRDLWELHERVEGLRGAIYVAVRRQWLLDTVAAEGSTRSLLAKWLPREGSKTWPCLASVLARQLYPTISNRSLMSHYRKAVATANKALRTAEVAMCGAAWSTLEPAHIPGRCFKIRKAALLNQPLAESLRGVIVRSKRSGSIKKRSVVEGQRRSEKPDRVKCAENVRAFLENVAACKATIKGANVVQPYELVKEVMSYCKEDSDTLNVVEAQWFALRDAAKEKGGLGRAVAMCDFSGSMAGTPLYVSLALGILISEINDTTFRDHILTFDSTPKWHSFTNQNSLHKKVNAVLNKCGQGLSTDFYKACMLVLERMEAARVPVGEEPTDLIVLTDMGWDAAHASPAHLGYGGGHGYSQNTAPWKTQIQLLQEKFKEASERVWGLRSDDSCSSNGWKVPRIVIWNLRADYKDFHAAAEDEGVVMLSGWSPNVLTALQRDGVLTQTPLEGVRAALDAPRYDDVREAVRAMIAV